MVRVEDALIEALREDLSAASWTVDAVDESLGPIAAAALAREQRLPGLLKLRGLKTPAAILTRLFILGDRVEDLAEAFPRLGTGGARKLGLLDEFGTRALVDLRPHSAVIGERRHDWWVASDLAEAQTGRPLNPDHVLGIGSATLSLLRLTVREPVESALDLGTGCGILALYLATHCQRVVATDISARACSFARFNASLNGAAIEVRQGSLYQPVDGESFDLITTNPPFVITPERVRQGALMEYRDSGADRDNLTAAVVREAPSYLRPGGLLQMLANWEIRPDSVGWDSRVRTWLDLAADGCRPDGLRAWVVLRDMIDYSRYAEMWMRDSGGQFVPWERWESDYALWVEDFAAAQVEQIAMGFLVARRDPGIPGVLCEAQESMDGQDGALPDGQAVITALANLTLPANWESRRLARAGDVREERFYVPGSPDPQLIRLSQGGGAERTIQVSSHVAALVGASDGELTVEQVIQALAALTGESVRDVRADILQGLSELLRSGMVAWLE